jgi:2-polyprenyl-3-methyl-5-hydroxy-6-metoxy-1,4-benzoquinol methylase
MLAHRLAVIPDPDRANRPSLSWEETACPLCGRDDAELFTEASDPIPADGPGLRFAVVRCRHCKLAYTNPRPTPESIARFYPPDYRPHRPPPAGRQHRPPSQFWNWVFGRPCTERRGALPGSQPGRLLDFGCGSGGYLRRMADLGWRVTGLDMAEHVVRTVRDKLACDAVVGTLPHPELAPASFDVVTMWQSLEHVHQPLAILREALRALVPGGTAVIAVPNFAGNSAHWFGSHWFGLDLPRHLTHFTPTTLTDMLRTAGFRVKSVRGLVHTDWLRSSARLAVKAGAGGLGSRLMCWKPLAKAVSWASYAMGKAEAIVAIAERPE